MPNVKNKYLLKTRIIVGEKIIAKGHLTLTFQADDSNFRN